MKKLRERLSNKKGFTLVELIVVIVIILILAAVLIPNVMRYIDSARKSAFQSEASSYLTELQGYEAEYYAKETKDIEASSIPLPGGGTFTGYSGEVLIEKGEVTGEALQKDANSEKAKITATVKNGAVIAFGYTDGKHWVSWQQDKGWTTVDENTFPGATE